MGLENMILPLSSGLKTHGQRIVPNQITQPSPTGIQAVISYKLIAHGKHAIIAVTHTHARMLKHKYLLSTPS